MGNVLFAPGIIIGETKIKKDGSVVLLFSDLSQITFINIDLENFKEDN